MHAILIPEYRSAISLMKYSVNHWWKFRNADLAFIVGLSQFFITILIEFTNVYVVVLTSESVIDILADFVVLLAIADFDNQLLEIRPKDYIYKRLTEEEGRAIFTWETTTSWMAMPRTDEFRLPEESVLRIEEMNERPTYIGIRMSDRPCLNKILYIIFRAIRLFYNAIIHYYIPFIATFVLSAYMGIKRLKLQKEELLD